MSLEDGNSFEYAEKFGQCGEMLGAAGDVKRPQRLQLDVPGAS